jgi:iron(III) transport system substrate-binding protein
MKKIALGSFCLLLLFGLLSSCKRESNQVVIYATTEDFRNEYFIKRINEKFPQHSVILTYAPTGSLAAKLKAEGIKTECDIIIALDTSYLEDLNAMLADLSSYKVPEFLDGLVPAHKKYLPWERWSGCVAVNITLLGERQVPLPASYADLLRPEYKGLISMPNPKSSGTGYMLLKNLVNVWGEDRTFEYFDGLAENILQFTSSGSGPVNALLQGEAGIGLGMTFQAVTMNNNGANLYITYCAEGAP